MSWNLAQVNIARTKAPFDHTAMAGLTSRIAAMNALAESSPGFVWRFISESDEENRLEVFSDYFVPFERTQFFFNMSVWKSLEALRHYVFKTEHDAMFRERHSWMDSFSRAHAAMWWLPEDRRPTVAEAKIRLLEVDRRGPSPDAFTFAKPFPPPSKTEPNR
jgi:hypothetical protein